MTEQTFDLDKMNADELRSLIIKMNNSLTVRNAQVKIAENILKDIDAMIKFQNIMKPGSMAYVDFYKRVKKAFPNIITELMGDK